MLFTYIIIVVKLSFLRGNQAIKKAHYRKPNTSMVHSNTQMRPIMDTWDSRSESILVSGSRAKLQDGFVGVDSCILNQICKQFCAVPRSIFVKLIGYGIKYFSEFHIHFRACL